jgi:hypothetical protein
MIVTTSEMNPTAIRRGMSESVMGGTGGSGLAGARLSVCRPRRKNGFEHASIETTFAVEPLQILPRIRRSVAAAAAMQHAPVAFQSRSLQRDGPLDPGLRPRRASAVAD